MVEIEAVCLGPAVYSNAFSPKMVSFHDGKTEFALAVTMWDFRSRFVNAFNRVCNPQISNNSGHVMSE
jgi:hypothetical protein